MCGINGFSWCDQSLAVAMNLATKNRGPDDEGVYSDSRITLGHVRLSIIDLSEKGHQPMSNEDNSLWIVYNGEIYNYQEIKADLIKKGHIFASRTDTEVILHAYEEYGIECLQRFNGMWSFCIYDCHEQSMILCRDRFGIKPLYYHISASKLIFSSMLAGILCHKVQTAPNDKAIMEFLAYNLEDHREETFFKNILQLKPGTFLKFDLDAGTHLIKQWYLPKKCTTYDEETIRNTFIDSVRLRTIADVPVGSCLSGGVDSSAIVCTMDQSLDDSFHTFSFVAPGTPIDETRYIKSVGRQTDTKQYFTQISEKYFLSEFEDFVKALEEPVLSPSPYAQYRVMKLASQKGAKVLLDGQGGDEIFTGYVYYFSYYYLDLLKKNHWNKLFKEILYYLVNFKDIFPIAMLIFILLPGLIKSIIWKKVLKCWLNHKLLIDCCGKITDPRWQKISLVDAQRLTLFTTAIPHLLRWEDKNSMRWGIESRIPFLDVRLVEAALSLPSEAKLGNGRTKVAFRKAVDKILPEKIRNRKDKIGFKISSDNFFRKPEIVKYCKSIIFSDSFKSRPYWQWEKVEKLFTAHIENRKNCGDLIWKWINLEVWLRLFFNNPLKPL